MSHTPRDLKEITDLVAKKLEIYLNIDKREQHFDTEGCFRVSPRMHKYDVMYRLLENQELEKKKTKTPRTPRSKTPVISRTRQKSPYLAIQYSVRSKSKEKKISHQKPGRSKTAVDKSPARSRSSQRKGLKGKEKNNAISSQINSDQKPIAVKTPRTPRSTVSGKEVKRLENYANLVYEEFPVEDLQKLHNLCPSLPDAGKVQNYTCHVGSALNTKHYVDFYLKKGLAGNQRYQHGKRNESRSKSPVVKNNKTSHSKLGSVSSPVAKRRGGNSRDRQTHPRSKSTHSAVVRFISPESSDQVDSTTPGNTNFIRSTRTVSSDISDLKPNISHSSNSDKIEITPVKVTSQEQQTSDTSEINREIWSMENESRKSSELNIISDVNENKPSGDLKTVGASANLTNDVGENCRQSENARLDIESPFPRCRSRIGRQTSSLQVDYSSHTTEESFLVRSSDDASTRTNSPESTRESLQTHSSYREEDSSDSSSSVLRYYTLSTQSTGAVYGSNSKSYKSPKKRNRNSHKNNSDESLKMSYNPVSKQWDKNPQEIVHTFRTVLPTKHEAYSSSSSLSSSSSTPRYNIIPECRLLKRSSLTNSVSDSTEETKMFIITPRSMPKGQRKRPKIDLNLTVTKKENSNRSTTGDDDVFWDRDGGGRYADDDNLFMSRGEDYLSNESKQSRGSTGCDWSTNSQSKCERYHTLMRESESFFEKDTQTADHEPSRNEDQGERNPLIIDRVSDITSIFSTYCKSDTFEARNNEMEPAIDDTYINKQEEKKDVIRTDIKAMNESSTARTKVQENIGESRLPGDESSQQEEAVVNSTEGTSDAESLNRGSDGFGKDGRGKGRICSSVKRRSNRGCQWEDEEGISNKQINGQRYKLDSFNLPDERGGYEILPESRGSSTEKGWQEGKSESYIIVIPKAYPQKNLNTTIRTPKQQEIECRGAVPPVRHSMPEKSRIPQETSLDQWTPEEENAIQFNSWQTISSSGGTCEEKSNHKKDTEQDVEIIPNTQSITKAPDSEYPSSNSESETMASDVSASQKNTKDEENFTLSSEITPKNAPEVRGTSNHSIKYQDQHPHILMKYRNSFPLSDIEMAMVFDLKEKTDEHRGSVGLNDVGLPPDNKDHHGNILGRGQSTDSSITSTLSWTEKYAGVDDQETDKPEETALDANVVDVPKGGPVEESYVNSEPKHDKENINDDRGDKELDNITQSKLYENKDNQRLELILGQDDRRVEGMLNQLEMLVQAKSHLIDGAMEREDVFARGEESEDPDFHVDSSQQHIMIETSQQYQNKEKEYKQRLVLEKDKKLQETKMDDTCSFEPEKKDKKSKPIVADGHSDIRVLKSPCLAVSKSDTCEVLDLQKLSKKPKQRCKTDTRGDLAPCSKQRRPRSAATSKTSNTKILRRKRSKSANSRS